MKRKSIFVRIMLCCCLLFLIACASEEGTTEAPSDTGTETLADTGTDDTVYELRFSCQDSADIFVTESVPKAIDAIYE